MPMDGLPSQTHNDQISFIKSLDIGIFIIRVILAHRFRSFNTVIYYCWLFGEAFTSLEFWNAQLSV